MTHVFSDDLTFSGLPSELLFFGRTFTVAGANFTYGVVLMLVLYAIAWFVLGQTAWGRHVYAVGDDLEAARLTGIKTGRVLLSVYTVAGLTYGIAAMLLVSRTEPAIRTPARRRRTSTPSPLSFWAARACSAAAAP